MSGLGLDIGLSLRSGLGAGWTPAALGPSLLGWWDAERFDSLALSGSAVTGWTDVVGGVTAAQAVSASRPRWDANAFGGVLNKCANFNNNPQSLANVTKSGDAASTLALVDDSAALAAIGQAGNVFKLDNSAGTTPAIASVAGTVGNTNPHSMAAFIRGGSGFLTWANSTPDNPFAAQAAYRRVTRAPVAPDLISRSVNVWADPGQIVYFILNGLYEGGDPGVDVLVNGAPAYGFGRPGLVLDGVDDFLGLDSGTALYPTTDLDGLSEMWALVDQQAPLADATTRGALCTSGAGGTSVGRSLRRQTSGVSRAVMGTGDGTVVGTIASTGAVFEGKHVIRGTAGNSLRGIDIDATGLVSNGGVIGTHSERLRIGTLTSSANFWMGGINSLLITGPLSSGQAAQLFTYLKARGSIF